MLVWLTLPFYIFAVFDPSPLTLCINYSFFTFITLITGLVSRENKAIGRVPLSVSLSVRPSVCFLFIFSTN